MSSLAYLPGLILALVAVGSDSSIPQFFETCFADEHEPWSYRGLWNGPSQWARLFPRDCSGRKQSPIAIDSDSTENMTQSLGFGNYDVSIPAATMVNNGHTVQIMPDDGVERTIVVDGDEYVLAQFHFHWGLTAGRGSEHTLDGQAYAMELHLVHLTSDGRVAVVGVFFKQTEMNDELQNIVDSLSDVRYRNDSTSLQSSLVLANLLPKDKSFYRYDGSLTTPNCTEGVSWSVMSKPIQVGQPQMKEFRSLFSVNATEAEENADCLIAPNYRPIQPRNGRTVYYSE